MDQTPSKHFWDPSNIPDQQQKTSGHMNPDNFWNREVTLLVEGKVVDHWFILGRAQTRTDYITAVKETKE